MFNAFLGFFLTLFLLMSLLHHPPLHVGMVLRGSECALHPEGAVSHAGAPLHPLQSRGIAALLKQCLDPLIPPQYGQSTKGKSSLRTEGHTV